MVKQNFGRYGKRFWALLLALFMTVQLLPAIAHADGDEPVSEDTSKETIVTEENEPAEEPDPEEKKQPEEPEQPEEPVQDPAPAEEPDEEKETDPDEPGVVSIGGIPEADLTEEEDENIVDSGTCGDNLTWMLTSDGTLTISGTGNMWDWQQGKSPWQSFSRQIKSVKLQTGVTTIGRCAFVSCRNLISVTIPSSVTFIGSLAFQECYSLPNITIPVGVTHIGYEAFLSCRSLTSVAIPSSVSKISGDAFRGCTNLTAITVQEQNEAYCALNGILYDINKTELVACPGGMVGHVTIPEGVTTIGNYSFAYCKNIMGVTIPDGVTHIGKDAFWNCTNLTSVTIPSSVISIDPDAFWYCTSLTSITIPEGVTSISFRAFGHCSSLTSVTIPENVTSIGDNTFEGCTNLTSVTILGSVTSIGRGAFALCTGLTNVTFPESVTSIGAYAFYNCNNLTGHLTIPEGVASIGNYAFYDCENLTSIWFYGTPPAIDKTSFNKVTATAYYPVDNVKWTKEVRQNYGGKITWVPHKNGTPFPFTDVVEGKYYYEPVIWAYFHEPQITSGTGDREFSPNAACTRAQAITFLWNAVWQPKPSTTENPFSDVKAGKYYYKAVLWAYENGITSGTTPTTFGPNDECTRAQVVMFLWAAAGKPEPTITDNPFTDVQEEKYYYKAILWAVENGISSGTSETTFSPDKACTRVQVITMLYNRYGDN